MSFFTINKSRHTGMALWTRVWFALALLYLTTLSGCLESLDPQLTPQITAITPDVIAQGGTIRIEGSNFSFQNAAITVTLVIEGEGQQVEVWKPAIAINPSTGASVINFAETEKLPAGSYVAYLLIKDRENDRTSNKFPFTIEAFRIDAVTPARGPVGTAVTLTGNGLVNIEAVLFRSLDGVRISVKPSSQTNNALEVTVPDGALPGFLELKLQNRISPVTSEYFKVTLPPPTVTAISPAAGVPGSKVVITGTNLGIANEYTRQVLFEDKDKQLLEAQISTATEESNANQITVLVPAKAVSGPVTVWIDTVQAAGALSFTVEKPVAKNRIVTAANGQISVIYLNEGEPAIYSDVYVKEGSWIHEVSLNPTNERIYFSLDNALRSVNISGEDEQVIHTFGDFVAVVGIRAVGQHIYWIQDWNTIWRCALDGSGLEQIGSGDASIIDVDPEEQYVYWYNWADPIVQRIKADGTGSPEELFLTTDIEEGSADGLLFKVAGERLFISYYDPSFNTFIMQGSLTGDGKLQAAPVFAVDLTVVSSIGYDVANNKVYWVQNDFNNPICYRADPDGTNKEQLFMLSELGVLPTGVFSVY